MTGDPGGPGSLYIQALALGLDPAWRRQPDAERHDDVRRFAEAELAVAGTEVVSVLYSSVALEPGVDLLLWRMAPSMEALETAGAATLRSGLGRWLTVRHSLLGRIAPSQYVRKPTSQEQSMFAGERSRYIVVYPFTKSTEWYLTSRE